jgi:hypothetical protein
VFTALCAGAWRGLGRREVRTGGSGGEAAAEEVAFAGMDSQTKREREREG